MAMSIGYNIPKANELMANIATAYNNLGIYTKEQWSAVSSSLRTNWIGTDEVNYEMGLGQRINNLYNNSYDLVLGCCNTIAGLARAWYDFQQKNTLGLETSHDDAISKLEIPTITKNEKIINTDSIATYFISGDDRGLTSDSSASNIKQSLASFVGEIKQRTQSLFEEIEVGNAFFGNQTSSIKSYIVKVGEAVGEVTAAVKDIYDAVDTLANTSYATSVENIASQMNAGVSNVDETINSLGNSRWSA